MNRKLVRVNRKKRRFLQNIGNNIVDGLKIAEDRNSIISIRFQDCAIMFIPGFRG